MNIRGFCKVLFVGKDTLTQIDVDCIVQDSSGHPVYILGTDGAIYNWSNIIMIIKASQ